jgi:HTH-type transcriptional regulator / antitoxin HigA
MAVTANTTVADTYMELISEFPLRRIKTDAMHAKATKIVLRLSTQRADRGTTDYLDVLIDLIADYEKRSEQTLDSSKVSASDLVRHRLDERGMSVSALARLIGVPQSNLSEMLAGKRDWSKAAIRGLAAQFNIRTDRFLL